LNCLHALKAEPESNEPVKKTVSPTYSVLKTQGTSNQTRDKDNSDHQSKSSAINILRWVHYRGHVHKVVYSFSTKFLALCCRNASFNVQ